jgi:hypothetical protein
MLAGGRRGPIGRSTCHRQIFEHTRADACPASIKFALYFPERGFRMVQAPFAHSDHNLLGHPMPGLLVNGVAHRIAPVKHQ